jgi:choline dehydrogenase-like flavoprotein
MDTTDRKRFLTDKEVILSCGALDTPRVLMHSGIRPVHQRSSFDILLVVDNLWTAFCRSHLHPFDLGASRAYNDVEYYFIGKKVQATARA